MSNALVIDTSNPALCPMRDKNWKMIRKGMHGSTAATSTSLRSVNNITISSTCNYDDIYLYQGSGQITRVVPNNISALDLLKTERVQCVIGHHAAYALSQDMREILDNFAPDDLEKLRDDGWDISDHPEVLLIKGGVVRRLTEAAQAQAIAASYAKMSDKRGIMHMGGILESACFESDLYNLDGTVKVDKFQIHAKEMPSGPVEILLHDGSFLRIEHDASYTWNPKNKPAAIRHRPRRRNAPLDFNRFMNASDVLEEFIKFCGELGISVSQFKKLPIELFIVWLVQEAERHDGLDVDENSLHKKASWYKVPRCQSCGKYLNKERAKYMSVCGVGCADMMISKQKNEDLQLMVA